MIQKSNRNSNNFQVDFIGIGAPKCGTGWIYACLREHPQICMSEPKELHFFNKLHGFRRGDESWRYSLGMDWYKKHFLHCKPKQIKGEITPGYIYEKEALQLIRKHFPNIKIIISLRNPIDRTFSNYRHIISKDKHKNIFKSFEQALQKELEFLKGRSLYSRYIKNCFEIFPKENILVLIYEDLNKNPLTFIQKIYNFLRVNEKFIPKTLYKKRNISAMKMSKIKKLMRKTSRFLNSFRAGRTILKILKTIRLREILEFFILKFKKPMKMKESTRKELHQFFKKDIAKLEKLLNRDLSFWY